MPSLDREYGGIYMDKNRQMVEMLKERIQGTRMYEKLLDAIYECVQNTAEDMADDMGCNKGLVCVALQEMVGIADTYTDEDIADMVDIYEED